MRDQRGNAQQDTMNLREHLLACPLLAILRGIQPSEVEAIAAVLINAGISNIEIPLNSPQGLDSIGKLASRYDDKILIGAGTVLRVGEVDSVAAVGGRLIVSPHVNVNVVRRAKALNLIALPGAATPTEAYRAMDAGADGIKMFPAEMLPPSVVRAWRAVLPQNIPLLPVGGIVADNTAAYRAAGASGFGIGSSLYKPGMSTEEVKRAASALISSLR